MDRLVEKNPELHYIEEQSGEKVNYLDVQIGLEGNRLKIRIYRKNTHTWDLPKWDSRGPRTHKKAAVIPLMIRAYRLLKDKDTRMEEIKLIFGQGINRGYVLRILKRWNKEAEEISKKPKLEGT